LRRIQGRLRRLEHSISPELTESQHQWFISHLASGRHGAALASLTSWIADGHEPLPGHLREEVGWLASSLRIEHLVAPILDAERSGIVVRASTASDHTRDDGFDVPIAEFQALVVAATDALPLEFRSAMDSLVISVEEAPDHGEAFGRYVGVPMTKRRLWNIQPDKIILYRAPICAACHSVEQVRAEVYRTVVGEVAHHFGIGDPARDANGP
jgi:predicted Zn-dependent protease with MMP-like domain